MTKLGGQGNIVSYGIKRILIAFISLQLVTLLITSFFILKPFMQIASDAITSQMLIKLSNNSNNSSNIIKADLNNQKFYQLSRKKVISSYHLLPILLLIENDLQLQLNTEVRLVSIASQPNFYWFQIPKKQLSIGFSQHLIGTQPELTMLLLFVFLTLLASVFSFYISKKLNQPLVRLKEVTYKISQGDFSARLPQQELLELNEAFEQINQLTYHFEHLLEQRVIFLSGISHDIRTPLTRLKLLLAIHQEKLENKFTLKTNVIITEMEALISLYLDSSKYLLESNTKLVVINQLLNDILINLDDNQKDLVRFNSSNEIKISINQSAFSRVVNNLLSNSLKYAIPEKTGEIDISLTIHKKFLQISIADHGEGLPDKELEEIFKPFFRSNNQLNSSSGVGLGLSICRQICLSQGWELQLSNNNPGIIAMLKIPYDYSLGNKL